MVRRIALAAAAGPAAVIVGFDIIVLLLGAFGHHPWWPDRHLNLSEATAVRDQAEVARFLESGESPDARRLVRPGLVGNDTDVRATPLEAAISVRRPELIDMLFERGARPLPAEWHRLRCAAQRLEYTDVIAALDRYRPSAIEVRCSGDETLW